VIDSVLNDHEYYPVQGSPEHQAIKALRDRLQAENDVLYAEIRPSTRKR
jgi:hypothetical protein